MDIIVDGHKAYAATGGKAFDAVIQALKHAGIPVAGADRLKLTEHIAVIDLMHLADALLLPRDDLALAVALKSPLFGLDDDDLLVLAPQREGTLREALEAHAATHDKYAAALRRLVACERRAATDSPSPSPTPTAAGRSRSRCRSNPSTPWPIRGLPSTTVSPPT